MHPVLRLLTLTSLALLVLPACRGETHPDAEAVRADRGIERASGGGIVHVVRVAGDGPGLRFQPAEVEVEPGDAVRFVHTRAIPIGVSFEPTGLSPEARAWALEAGLHRGPLLTDPGAVYEVDFADAPPGSYRYLAPGWEGGDLAGRVEVVVED